MARTRSSAGHAPLAAYLALRAGAIERAPADAGLALCHTLSDTLDAALATLLPAGRDDLALVAVGGYGRREQCLFSDIDLMLLCRDRADRAAADAIFYPLWDAGLKVGHAVRTLAEAEAAAAERLETLTALLDARLIGGAGALLESLRARLLRRLSRGRSALATALRAADAARRIAEPFQLQEANVKEGRGGLRTLQRLRWLSLIAGGQGETPHVLQPALATLLCARNALHAVSGRAQDVWLLEGAPAACRWLGADPVEFPRSLYLAQREIERAAGATASEATPPTAPARGFALRRRPAEPKATVRPASVRAVLPHALALAEAGAGRLPDADAASVAAAHGTVWSAADRDALLSLLRLGERGVALIEELARLGWLERTVPEWRHTRGQPQYAPFHLHPLDTHMQRTVVEAVALAERDTPERWCRPIADELGGLDEVLLAALLHDIGKGWPGDHAETGAAAAGAIARRARFPADLTHTVVSAVRHHLLLPLVATRRDITDAGVVAQVADAAGRARTLRVLCLLSVADSRATGPAVWSEWKGSLMRDLYQRALAVLEARESATPLAAAAPDAVEALVGATAGRYDRAMVARHLRAMPPGYTRAFAVAELERHLDLMSENATGLRYNVRSADDAHDVVLALPDRPGLIALVAGVLALHSLSVLEARFFTRADGIALQAYQLVDALPGRQRPDLWRTVAQDIERALAGSLQLEERLAEKTRAYHRTARLLEPDVRLDRAAGGEYTLLEVHATDRIGLLNIIARTLYAQRLDIHFAKIDTQGRQVVDVFYLRDFSGAPLIDGERLRDLRLALRSALGH